MLRKLILTFILLQGFLCHQIGAQGNCSFNNPFADCVGSTYLGSSQYGPGWGDCISYNEGWAYCSFAGTEAGAVILSCDSGLGFGTGCQCYSRVVSYEFNTIVVDFDGAHPTASCTFNSSFYFVNTCSDYTKTGRTNISATREIQLQGCDW